MQVRGGRGTGKKGNRQEDRTEHVLFRVALSDGFLPFYNHLRIYCFIRG